MDIFKKKDKDTYEEIPTLIGEGSDYHVYHMKLKDIVIAFIIGAGGAAVVLWLFFKNVLLCAIASVIVGIYAQRIYQQYILEKRKNALRLQFKDLLESLTSSYSAGKNTLEAFTDAQSDLEHIYGENTDIVLETSIIVHGMSNNINVEELLLNFADRSGLDDVRNFADVFRVAIRQGANIKDIIFSTRDIISDKIEIEMELNSIMAGNKNQLNIMMVMPLVIIVSLEGMGGNGMSAADNTPLNIVIKVVSLGLFFLAYYLGKKFTAIEV